MKKLILMAVCLVLGNVCITVPAIADCRWGSDQDRRDCEEQEARTEYMKSEAELMKKKAEMIEKCNSFDPPSYCK
jgi:hypothetical protein